MKADGNRIIFVGGVPRSGTTLVQNILDSHPDIFGGPEFDRIPNVVDLRRKFHSSISNKRIDIYCSKDQVDRAIAAYIESLLLPIADKNNCKFISEKTPWNILAFLDLLEIFPKSHFIHVVRDPRGVIASMLKVGEKAKRMNTNSPDFTRDIKLAIHYIGTCHKIADEATKRAPDRVITVVYEKLISEPEKETKRVCEFLKINWVSDMMYPNRKKHAGENKIVDIWYDKKMYNRNPEPSEINKWKAILNPSDQVFISFVFSNNEEIAKYGYDFSVNNYKPWHILQGFIKYKIFKKKYGNKMAKLRVLP